MLVSIYDKSMLTTNSKDEFSNYNKQSVYFKLDSKNQWEFEFSFFSLSIITKTSLQYQPCHLINALINQASWIHSSLFTF